MSIEHLCMNRYVFKNLGFSKIEYPHNYVYEISGNFGDSFKVTGGTYIGELILSREDRSYILNFHDIAWNLVDFKELAAPLKLILHDFWFTNE